MTNPKPTIECTELSEGLVVNSIVSFVVNSIFIRKQEK